MASLTIIPYLLLAITSINKGFRINLRIPVAQAIAEAGEAGRLMMHEDGDGIGNGHHLPRKRRGSHSSAHTDQGTDQACSQKSKDRGASVNMSGFEEVGLAGEYGVPDQAGLISNHFQRAMTLESGSSAFLTRSITLPSLRTAS